MPMVYDVKSSVYCLLCMCRILPCCCNVKMFELSLRYLCFTVETAHVQFVIRLGIRAHAFYQGDRRTVLDRWVLCMHSSHQALLLMRCLVCLQVPVRVPVSCTAVCRQWYSILLFMDVADMQFGVRYFCFFIKDKY